MTRSVTWESNRIVTIRTTALLEPSRTRLEEVVGSTFWLESMENIFEPEAILEMDSLISLFLLAKTPVSPKVIC